MFTQKAQPIRIIGGPDIQRPDKWISTVTEIPSASVSTRKYVSCRGKKYERWELSCYSGPCDVWGTVLG